MGVIYKVLRDTGTGYEPAGEVDAHSPSAAAKAVDQERGYHYLVVPAANAHFVSLGIEQPPPRVTAKVEEGPRFPMVGQVTLAETGDETLAAEAQ